MYDIVKLGIWVLIVDDYFVVLFGCCILFVLDYLIWIEEVMDVKFGYCVYVSKWFDVIVIDISLFDVFGFELM